MYRLLTTRLFTDKKAYSASLAVFRFIFGMMLMAGVVRFWLKGWIDTLYIQPQFFFHYYGFEWVKPLGVYTYVLFVLCGISAFCFAIGYRYRLSSILLFLSFSYIELMDKTNYLNHYYFVTLVLFVMMWLPAHVNLSVDAWLKPSLQKRFIPLWTVGSIRLLMGIVYVYAGLAKLNSDWLIEAMPLRLWLPANNDLPVIGPLFNQLWVAYAFSWAGAAYDLFIPFLLLNKKTRPFAFVAVVVFHVLTSILFPIGMFPYIMITSALVFVDSAAIDRIIHRLKGIIKIPAVQGSNVFAYKPKRFAFIVALFTVFFSTQAILPWRYMLMPDELFWTEEGYRFSWRVMLMEKMGYARFKVKDGASGKVYMVNNEEFLTRNQEKMMATQPDFILQYAQFLKKHFEEKGVQQPEVYAEVYVSMNGRRSREYIDPNVNLAMEQDNFEHKKWIRPFPYKIYGL